MKLLQYPVTGVLYQPNSTIEAKVGDEVRLYLDVESDPAFPEFVTAVIQNPINKDNCRGTTTYTFEYDEGDLNGAVAVLRAGHVTYVVVASPLDAIVEALEDKVDKTTTVNGKALTGNITLVTGDFADATFNSISNGGKLLKTNEDGQLTLEDLTVNSLTATSASITTLTADELNANTASLQSATVDNLSAFSLTVFVDDAEDTHSAVLTKGVTGGTGSAGAGNQYVQVRIGNSLFNLLHDGENPL